MILEAASLQVKPGRTQAFESAFREAQSIISSMPGYRSHPLRASGHRHLMGIRASITRAAIVVGACAVSAQVSAAAPLWSSSTRDFGDGRSDFTLREVERRPRSSVLQLEIRNIGSSVGSSMLIACMMTRLAEERGGYRYLLKIDARATNPKQMLVGFSRTPGENPQAIDPELPPSATEVDLEVFGPQFNKSCRAKKE